MLAIFLLNAASFDLVDAQNSEENTIDILNSGAPFLSLEDITAYVVKEVAEEAASLREDGEDDEAFLHEEVSWLYLHETEVPTWVYRCRLNGMQYQIRQFTL